jgi:hypothetical protein
MVYGSPENLKMKFPMIHEEVRTSMNKDFITEAAPDPVNYVKKQILIDDKIRNLKNTTTAKTQTYEEGCNTLTGYYVGKTQQFADKCRKQRRILDIINQNITALNSYHKNFEKTAILTTDKIKGEENPYIEKTIRLMHHFAKHAYVEVSPSDQSVTSYIKGIKSTVTENGYTFYTNKQPENKSLERTPYIYSTFRGKYLESFKPDNIEINDSSINTLYILNRYVNNPEYKSKIPNINNDTLSTDIKKYNDNKKLPTRTDVKNMYIESKNTDIFEKNKRIIEWADFDSVEDFETYIVSTYVRKQGTLENLQSESKNPTAAPKQDATA